MAPPAVPAPPANRPATEHEFSAKDGVRLFYRAWLLPPPPPKLPGKQLGRPPEKPKRAVVLFHRGHEHSGRFQEMVDLLAMQDYSIFAWDARGHGRSPGDRGFAASFGRFVSDCDAFIAHISDEYKIPIESMAIIGHSVGAVIAATWVLDYAPPIRCLVLGGPALRVKLYVPLAMQGLRALSIVRKKSFVQSYVKPSMLTHDPAEQDAYRNDPLITRAIAVNILIGMHDAATRLLANASSIRVPTLILASGKDWVVEVPPQRDFCEKLGSARKEFKLYPEFFHDLFHETDRQQPIAKAREFIVREFAETAAILPPSEANQARYEQLRNPLPPYSPARWAFGAQRVFLKTIGRLSHGVGIGWKSGFDSGESLDHIYRNAAKGTTPLGRMIDRIYLASPGWNGIRQRKVNLERLLTSAIDRLGRDRKPVNILDVASGHGRYVLETMQRLGNAETSAVLRDFDPAHVEATRLLAQQLGVSNISCVQADAFDRDSYNSLNPAPNLAIVSGLFELFPDNKMVRTALRGIASVIPKNGCLIYTNQPWHPQLEMIARVLDNRQGKPWIMRCRAQSEMDELVRRAGFDKVEMLTDDDGIFTVSLARRNE